MSAQKTPRRGVFSAIAGLIGFSALAGLLITVMVAPAIAVTGVTASSAIGIFDSLPEYIEIGEQQERNEIYANSSAGPVQIATVFSQNREEVPYEQISQFALDAAVDGEDIRFFSHGGVDVGSAVRAAVGQVTNNDKGGASTLTMQLVRNIFITQALEEPTQEQQEEAYLKATSKSLDRKLSEMKLAISLEKKYTKKEILTAYLNIANFGKATYGIQAAAQRYYSKNAKDLTLPEAASLVAIVQYPDSRNLGDPDNYSENQVRRDYILDAMLKANSITQQEHDEAIATPVDDTTIKASPPRNGCIAADDYAKWFCDYVVKSVPDFAFLGDTPQAREDNWKRGGYKLYTTLDMDLQRPAQDAVWTYAPNTETTFALGSVANTVQAGTGRVLVMAQNMLFDDSIDGGPGTTAVNYSTDFYHGGSSGFQPGSTYKLFTLLDWLLKGKGVNERVSGDANRQEPFSAYTACGEKMSGGTFAFKNNAGESGNYTIRDGTVNSINGVFMSMAKQLDLCDIRDVALSMGVKSATGAELKTNPTSVIGTNEVTPLSMAVAYAGLAALGNVCDPIIVDKFVNPQGVEAVAQTPVCRQAIPQNIAATAIDVLKGVMTTGNQLYGNPEDGIPIFGKTGTTDSANQTWVATGTSSAGSIVWVGNSVGDYNILDTEYAGVAGIRLRHYISLAVVTALNNKYGGVDWPAADPALLTGSGQAVPDLRGTTAAAAKTALEGLGFSYADGGAVDSDLAPGLVVSTDPPAGSNSAKGAIVTVYTSKGNQVPFPDVVGDGKTVTEAAAKSTLAAAKYPASVVQVVCAVLSPYTPTPAAPTDPRIGMVQSSNPSPGTPTVPGSAVTLTIGKATCP